MQDGLGAHDSAKGSQRTRPNPGHLMAETGGQGLARLLRQARRPRDRNTFRAVRTETCWAGVGALR